MSPEEPALLRQGRALFVLFHLLAVVTIALPSVGSGMNRSAWRTPTVQDEFAVWTRRFEGLGWNVGVDEVEETLWGFAVAYEDARARVLRPMLPYLRYTGTAQSWRMFVAPHRYPGRLVIEIDDGHGFSPIYVARSSEYTWRRRWFDHDRMRAAVFRYAWRHYRHHRGVFVHWVAGQVARDFPGASRVRVSFMRYRTLSAEEVRAGRTPEERRELSNTRTLAPFRDGSGGEGA